MNPQQQTDNNAITTTADNAPWYALRIFNNRQKSMVAYLEEQHFEVFVPQHYVDYIDKEGRRRHELKPIVYNLAFIKKTMTDGEIQQALSKSPYPAYIYRRSTDKQAFQEISAREMAEFQQMCNPEITLRKYLSEEEARLKPGAKVAVMHGPLKGITGRLVRISKKYYLLKEVPGMGIALKVSRWCCRAVEE